MTEYRGKEAKIPLRGVSVTAANAGSAMSDEQGRLSLQFRTLKVGDPIQFRRIDMAGYEVMNSDVLESAHIARQGVASSSLPIVMVPTKLLRQLRDGYRSVAAKRYEKQLSVATDEIEQLRKAGAMAEAEYNQRMDSLEADYEQKLTKLETYIDKFARIDLSDLDSEEQQIISLVQDGNFEEALAIYDHQQLAERLKQSRLDREKLVSAREQITAAERQKEAENERLRQSIDRQITLLRMAGGEENYEKIFQLQYETFLADTTHWEARRSYAKSLYEQARFEESLQVLANGIASTTDDYAKGMMMLDAMDTNWNSEAYDEAMRYVRQADSLLFPLRESHYTVLTRALPGYSLIELQYAMNVAGDFDKCQQIVDRVRQYWSPDTLSFPSMNSYSELLSFMADYHSRVLDHDESLRDIRENISLGLINNRLVPWSNSLSEIYANACSTYAIEGLHDEAVDAARQSLLLTEQTLKKAKSSFCTSAVMNSYTLLDALTQVEEYELADSVMTSLSKYQVFDYVNSHYPGMYDYLIELSQLNYVHVLLSKGMIEEAASSAETILSRLDTMEEVVDDISHLRPGILAKVRWKQGKTAEAEKLFAEAVETSNAAYKKSGEDGWSADTVCRYLCQLAQLKYETGAAKEGDRLLKQAAKYSVFESNRQMIERIKKDNYKSFNIKYE